MRRVLQALPGVVVGVLAFLLLRACAPEPKPVYRTVEVPVEKIVEVEKVNTKIEWRDRIVYRQVPATTVATATGGGSQDVERFCKPDTVQVSSAGEIQVREVHNPALLLRSVRTEAGWFFGSDKVVLTGPLGNGDLRQLTYKAHDGWQAHVMADSALFQSPRFWWARKGVEYGAVAGLVYLAGKVF